MPAHPPSCPNTARAAPRGARTAGKVLFGCGVGIWVLAAINLATAKVGRPLTQTQRQWLHQSRSQYWSCVRHTPAERRPSCHTRSAVLMSGRADPISVAVRSLVTPLMALLGLLCLAGGTLGLLLSFRVARGGIHAIRLSRWVMGVSAASSATLTILGILPETVTTAALAQSFSFAVLVCVKIPHPHGQKAPKHVPTSAQSKTGPGSRPATVRGGPEHAWVARTHA